MRLPHSPNIQNRPQTPRDYYTHRLAPFADVNGGAEEFVFEPATQNPLYSFRGPARLAGEFLPFGEIPPTISLHPTGAVQGLPFVTQDILIQESNEIDASGEYVPNAVTGEM